MSITKIAAVVMTAAVCTFAQINLLSNSITFRDPNNGINSTYHYGDLHLEGGNNGGTSWGWLYTNAVMCYGWANFYGKISANAGLDVYGNFNVYNGTKNFIQPHPTDSTKVIKYITIEAGEALTLVRGNSKTMKGIVEVSLPEHFSLVTSDSAPLTVLLTPEKAPVMLFVQDKSKEKVVVAMKKSDFIDYGDVEFAYQVTGVRDGFEHEETIIDANKTAQADQPNALSPKRQKMNERIQHLIAKEKSRIMNK
jgi:hypothetical protein